jgi:hypothetical protein
VSDYTQTEEYLRNLEYLTGEKIGVEQKEAETILQDGDLWPLIDAASMHPFYANAESVSQWSDAADKLHTLTDLAYAGDIFDNPAMAQSLLEATERAEAMLRRMRERVRETSAE